MSSPGVGRRDGRDRGGFVVAQVALLVLCPSARAGFVAVGGGEAVLGLGRGACLSRSGVRGLGGVLGSAAAGAAGSLALASALRSLLASLFASARPSPGAFLSPLVLSSFSDFVAMGSLLGAARYRKVTRAMSESPPSAAPARGPHDRAAGVPAPRSARTALEEEGAQTLRCPLVGSSTRPTSVRCSRMVAGARGGWFDVPSSFLTGEGFAAAVAWPSVTGCARPSSKRSAGAGSRAGPSRRARLHELASARRLAGRAGRRRRGHGGARAARPAGPPRGRQLYGEEPNRPLVGILERAGATGERRRALRCTPRRATPGRVAFAHDALAEGRVDAVAFTSASQSNRLWQVAREVGRRRSASRRVSRAVRRRRIGPMSSRRSPLAACASTSCPAELRDAPAVKRVAESLGPAPVDGAP